MNDALTQTLWRPTNGYDLIKLTEELTNFNAEKSLRFQHPIGLLLGTDPNDVRACVYRDGFYS